MSKTKIFLEYFKIFFVFFHEILLFEFFVGENLKSSSNNITNVQATKVLWYHCIYMLSFELFIFCGWDNFQLSTNLCWHIDLFARKFVQCQPSIYLMEFNFVFV
jgi:hypothetical protein